jgi:uncharacterized Zn-binding protein involved in type VI secretion
MMPAIARANGVDRVLSRTGLGKGCRAPMTTSTGSGTSTVFAGGAQIVLQGDLVALHPFSGCGPDLSSLSSFSSTVLVNGKGVGRIGDEYTSDNIITSGFPTIFVGG